MIITTRTVKKIHRREIGFNTLLIGGNERAMNVYREIEGIKNSPGYIFKGFISTNGVDRQLLDTPINYYGKYEQLGKAIEENDITEVIKVRYLNKTSFLHLNKAQFIVFFCISL